MPDKVRADIGHRIFERVTHAGLRAQMDDPVKGFGGKRHVERKIMGVERKVRSRQFGQPSALQCRIIIIVEVVDPQNLIAARQQRFCDCRADKPRRTGNQDTTHDQMPRVS